MHKTTKIILIVGASLEVLGIIGLIVTSATSGDYASAESDPRTWVPLTHILNILFGMVATACLTGFLIAVDALQRRSQPSIPKLPPTTDQPSQ